MSEVSVKPLRTFWHGDLKTTRSPAFDVEKGVAHELETLGLVEIRGDVAVDDEVETEQPAAENEAEPAPKKRGRPSAVDKDS